MDPLALISGAPNTTGREAFPPKVQHAALTAFQH